MLLQNCNWIFLFISSPVVVSFKRNQGYVFLSWGSKTGELKFIKGVAESQINLLKRLRSWHFIDSCSGAPKRNL